MRTFSTTTPVIGIWDTLPRLFRHCMSSIADGTMGGRSTPLVIDNFVILDILSKLKQARDKNEQLRQKLAETKQKLNEAVDDLKNIG